MMKQHAVVRIQLNIVAYPTYPEKFIRDNVVAPFSLLSVVIVIPPHRRATKPRVGQSLFCSLFGVRENKFEKSEKG